MKNQRALTPKRELRSPIIQSSVVLVYSKCAVVSITPSQLRRHEPTLIWSLGVKCSTSSNHYDSTWKKPSSVHHMYKTLKITKKCSLNKSIYDLNKRPHFKWFLNRFLIFNGWCNRQTIVIRLKEVNNRHDHSYHRNNGVVRNGER